MQNRASQIDFLDGLQCGTFAPMPHPKKKPSQPERFSPKESTGESFDDIVRKALAVKPTKAKKASRPKG